MPDSATKRNYKPTLNLPKTTFAMKANLVQNEPASMKRWAELGVYEKLRQREHPRGPYVFHDGPPYANGDIHLGHLLNKCLKDFVVRSRSMLGYDCPYTPGWDCHGLPIEHKVMQEMAAAAKRSSDPGIEGSRDETGSDSIAGSLDPSITREAIRVRRKCKAYAEKYVKTQSKQMQRLLTLADYDDPYLTMLPKYEAAVLEVFASMVEQGLVYRDKKPVHWSISNRTALAEAELEYQDREDTSVYVSFELRPPNAEGVGGDAVMIWTTTPWTLPANLAVAVSPSAEYGLYDVQGRRAWLACDLAPRVLASEGLDAGKPERVIAGKDLAGLRYHHPFVNDDRDRRVVTADYVTLEDGTGMVHTAPGHGVEDYQTGLREGLDVYCPVLEDGTFDDTVPDWLRGRSIWDANRLVCDRLEQSGHLFHRHTFTHSYPHDWRSKQPVIFRATEQWFVGVDRPPAEGRPASAGGAADTLRSQALAAANGTIDFLPAWGRNRLRGMLESRPDWCVSRQRSWGLPIPAFFPPEGGEGEPLLTAASVRAIAKVFAEHEAGSDAWFFLEPADLLKHYDPAADPDAPAWIKSPVTGHRPPVTQGGDTFDVWFESGSSWHAVLQRGWKDKQAARSGDAAAVADLYLEGSDQHRGWFQHSLLPALAVAGKPAFSTVLTHGFMVDRDGKKMSKSGGNALSVDDLMKHYGADVCRWWVASLNPDNDIKVDGEFFKLAGESYRKVRNTLRFMLSNLSPAPEEGQAPAAMPVDATGELDRWALHELSLAARGVAAAYESLNFRKACERLYAFCNETLSSVYLFAVKDRLYCDARGSPRRRSSQAAMRRIADALCRLLAPLLPHTADEAFRVLHGEDRCVHVETLAPTVAIEPPDAWSAFMAQRDGLLKAVEDFRQAGGVDNPLDVAVRSPHGRGLDPVDLADLLGVSRYEFVEGGVVEVVDLRGEPRCERSWKRDGTVAERSLPGSEFDGAMLSDRDFAAVRAALGV